MITTEKFELVRKLSFFNEFSDNELQSFLSVCAERIFEQGEVIFEEGSVGMVNLGSETESLQWFITQSPQASFDNKFTNFAQVVSGMEVVHQIEVGDKIKSMEILN